MNRFPDTITRVRQEAGYRNADDEFVPGAVVETPLRASVQPISLEDEPIRGGVRLSDRLRVFTPGDLRGAFEDRKADRVRLEDGREYQVEESLAWPARPAWPTHTEALLLRET